MFPPHVAPGNQHVGADMLGEVFCGQNLDKQQSVATGDWSQNPRTTSLALCLLVKVGGLWALTDGLVQSALTGL